MLAAGLQENKRATLVGSQTFGQGLIHSVQPLPDSFAVVFAAARFTTPLGKEMLHLGITPDKLVDSREMNDPRGSARTPNRQYRQAVNLLLAVLQLRKHEE
jgi:C-terminal processing protease CtpA/Prc